MTKSLPDGTSVDTSHLITYISSYVFPTSDRVFSSNIVLGVSLGGHAAWQCLLHDPRVSTAIVVVGCPDYYALMSDRAQLSKLRTGTDDSPPKEAFLGSKYFPAGLVEAVERYDPAGMLLGSLRDRTNATYVTSPSQAEQRRIVPLMTQSLSGKRILNLAGGADKLVPYRCAEPSLNWLKVSTSSSGWFSRGKFHIEDHVFEGVGHQMTIEMAEETMKFVATTLQQSIASNTQMASKI